MKSEVLSVKEKIGYGMGDAASHIIFDNVMLYMMFFYTDIFGIPAGFVGTMFLVARALDAISDPCMGLLADRTRSRWGKFRPWVLFGALPFGIVCVLAYSTPDLSMNGKMIYAAITYTLLTLLYTVVNIPYCALGGVITNDPTQRISLQSWRFVLATAGGMLSTVLTMPLVNLIGGDNKPLGFQGGIAVLSVVAFMMLAFCFFTTKERVEAPPTTTSTSSARARATPRARPGRCAPRRGRWRSRASAPDRAVSRLRTCSVATPRRSGPTGCAAWKAGRW